MPIPDSLFGPHTMSAAFLRKQDVLTLRGALGDLGQNGRHLHVLHGAPGLLTLNGRRDAHTRPLLLRVLDLLSRRTPPRTDRQETELLLQGGWVVLIDLPRDPRDRTLVREAVHRSGGVSVVDPDQPMPDPAFSGAEPTVLTVIA